MQNTFGLITLLGSGETSLAGGRVFETIAQQLTEPVRVAIMETPAGFELNSAQVAGRVAEFLETRLQNYCPWIDVIPARKRGTGYSPDDATILLPLAAANLIFMGPGSPTYAVRQLAGSLAWDVVRARHRLGAALVFASAAAIAIGARALPVYEIYKVGEEVHTISGLDIFADFGLNLSIIPHWNNSDGGADVDTSRCFVGKERFKEWHDLLPPGHITIGLDEHTGLIIDLSAERCHVNGAGSVTLVREGETEAFTAGEEFSLSKLGEVHWPETIDTDISAAAVELIHSASLNETETPPPEVLRLLNMRMDARSHKDWSASDRMRQQIADLGWQVQDSPNAQALIRKK